MKKKITIILTVSITATILIIVLLVVLFIASCHEPLPMFKREDDLDVEWDYSRLSQPYSFEYNGIEYKFLESYIWRHDHDAAEKVGSLMTGGTGKVSTPMFIFGIPFITGYNDAFSYVADGKENLQFIATYNGIWLDSNIQLDDKVNVPFIGCEYEKHEIILDYDFTFEQMIDRSVTIKNRELENYTSYAIIKLNLDEVKGLCCRIYIVRNNDTFYTPLEMGQYFNKEAENQELVLFTDEWQSIIRSLLT